MKTTPSSETLKARARPKMPAPNGSGASADPGSGEPVLGSILVDSIHEPWFRSFRRQVAELFHPPKPLPVAKYRPAQPGEDDLGPLEIESVHKPWFRSFTQQVEELWTERKQPPLKTTSKPVAVKSIWGAYDHKQQGLSTSVIVHVVSVVLLFTVFSGPPPDAAVLGDSITLIVPVDISPYLANLRTQTPDEGKSGGGGGGGQNSPLPASKGRLPRFDVTQLAPPTPVIRNPDPKLAVEPTLLGPQEIQAPQIDMAMYGDPLANVGPPSAGTGSGGGVGSGQGTGVGPGKGGGYGPGSGGGAGGGVYRIGGGVSTPRVLYKPEPEYSEEARKAKYQGTVLLTIEIWPDGKAHNIRVIRSLGLGLDEKAIEAVQKWRFEPGKKDGNPVKVVANVEVNFRLL